MKYRIVYRDGLRMFVATVPLVSGGDEMIVFEGGIYVPKDSEVSIFASAFSDIEHIYATSGRFSDRSVVEKLFAQYGFHVLNVKAGCM